MKLNSEVIIDASLKAVWDAFTDAKNLARWQQNFVSCTQKSGAPGQPGSVAELHYDEKGRTVVLTETVAERREQEFLAASYQSSTGSNLIVNRFEAVSSTATRWTMWCNFKFNGVMKLLSVFAGGAIRSRVEGDMQRFKLMVESDLSGAQG
ncbi:MAG: SRPBCC family protein [Gammaproteobacteria bacterium]|nr:SRPBCC family protein [Gammaproteobacteria bacterium]